MAKLTWALLSAFFLAPLVIAQRELEPEDLFRKISSDKDVNENFLLLKSAKKATPTENYRLPTSVLPDTYNLTVVSLMKRDFKFTGYVAINATVVESTNEISLHYKNLTILKYEIYDEDLTEIKVVTTKYNNVTDICTFVLEKHLTAITKVFINIEYEGVLSEDTNGLYRSSYYDSDGNRRWLATTQFEPVYARKAFPCFDEPGFKAKFNIRIQRPKNYTALSNMPKISTDEFSDSALDTFDETPRMSTYIVAMVISDFEYLYMNGSSVRIWSNRELVKHGQFALDFGMRVETTFGVLFNQTNPVPKTDMVAVPDFAAGAMENWGLITYREYLLIFENEENSDALQQSAASTISHELAHMWFGNLLSPEWWEFTWLNEGFANYFQHIGAHLVEPDWKADGKYYTEVVRAALFYDSSEHSQPVSHECSTPAEISEMFGTITYQKGGSVIRMMRESFGYTVFYGALREYISINKFSNVRSDFLWEALQNQINLHRPDIKVPVKDLMSDWINKPGHPVLFVQITTSEIYISQERFLLDKSEEYDAQNSSWYVPITVSSAANPNFTTAETELWINETFTLEYINATQQWVILNRIGAGFYRVNYDLRAWYRIIRTLNSRNYEQIHVLNRVAIIDDLFNLARGGYINYDLVLDALQYLPQETNYLAIKTALSGLQFLSHRFSGNEDEQLMNAHILSLIKETYNKHGYFDDKNDDKYTVFLRAEMNSIACKLNYTKCMANAVKVFAKWRKDPLKKIPRNQRSTTYCYALREGSAEDWEFLYEQYKKTINIHERLIILRSLGCTRNETLLERYLFNAMTDYDAENQIHKQDSLSLFQTVAQKDYNGAKFMLRFLAEHQEKVITYYKDNSTVVSLLLAASRSFTSQQRIDEFQDYIDQNSLIYKPIMSHLENIKKNAESQFEWYKIHSTQIIRWLYKMYPKF